MGLFLGFLSCPIIYSSIFGPVTFCFDAYSFVAYGSLKSGSLTPPAPFFILNISLAIWSHLFVSIQILRFFCSSSVKKNAIGNLVGIALNL